jgi:hypothetical protein
MPEDALQIVDAASAVAQILDGEKVAQVVEAEAPMLNIRLRAAANISKRCLAWCVSNGRPEDANAEAYCSGVRS